MWSPNSPQQLEIEKSLNRVNAQVAIGKTRKQHSVLMNLVIQMSIIHKPFVADRFGERAPFFPLLLLLIVVVFLLFVVVSCIVQCEMCLWSKQLLSMEP